MADEAIAASLGISVVGDCWILAAADGSCILAAADGSWILPPL